MSDRKNGKPSGLELIKQPKAIKKFHSRAEALGFANAIQVVAQATQQLQQAQKQLDAILSELDIHDFDPAKVYNITELNELVEAN